MAEFKTKNATSINTTPKRVRWNFIIPRTEVSTTSVKIQQGNEIDQTESIFETTNVRAKL
jgi:hypothetical protein